MRKLLLLLILLFLGQFTYSQSWINRPNLPSTERTAVRSFAIGSKGYFVGGESSIGNLFDVFGNMTLQQILGLKKLITLALLPKKGLPSLSTELVIMG